MVAGNTNFPSVLLSPVETTSKGLSAFNLMTVLHFHIIVRCLGTEREKPVSDSMEEERSLEIWHGINL